MGTNKALISEFLAWAVPHAMPESNVQQYIKPINPKDQWGYVLGWIGQVAKTGKWAGKHCMDCNGLIEYFLNGELGGNHNTFSRYNYSNWCSGFNGTDMSKMPQQPGTAIFYMGATIIEHVGFLYKRFGPRPTDWLVVEAANSKKGVIISRFHSRWNRWGQMRAKLVYDIPETTLTCPYAEPAVLPAYGQKGDGVRWLQWNLLYKGFKLPKYGLDGDFGAETLAAVKALQQKAKLPQTGKVDARTVAALKAMPHLTVWRNPYKEPATPPQAGAKGDAVRWLQWQLERKGYPLPAAGIDGDFGNETSAAVHELQRAHGLPAGPVTAETMRVLKM